MKCVPDITYDPEENLAFDLYLPDTLRADACVIFAHHGGFQTGSRDCDEARYVAQRLTEHGLAVAAMDYRLATPANAFPQTDADIIAGYADRIARIRLGLSATLYGTEFVAALEDLSKLTEYLWVEGEVLGIGTRNVGIFGIEAGGIAAMALGYPPREWSRRLSRPDAVIAVSGAIVQPWRLEDSGPPGLLFNGPKDGSIAVGDVRLGAYRAQQMGAPVQLVETSEDVPETQFDIVMDGADKDGASYFDLVLKHFEILREA